MIDAKLNELRSNLKQTFPEIDKEIDNLFGLLVEELLDGGQRATALRNLENDLKYTLSVHNIEFDSKTIHNLLK